MTLNPKPLTLNPKPLVCWAGRDVVARQEEEMNALRARIDRMMLVGAPNLCVCVCVCVCVSLYI